MGQPDTANTALAKGSAKSTLGLWQMALVFSLSCPLLVIAAVFGTRLGLWGLGFGFEVLALQLGRVLAWVGLAAVVVASLVSVKHLKQVWPYIAASLVCAVVSFAGFMALAERYTGEGAPDVTTDVAQPPAFSRVVTAERRGAGTTPVACPGLEPVMRQSAPENALYAMQKAGFTAYGSSAFRADGYRESFWFGQMHHVAIRIRPGRTDVRVAARYPVEDGGQACQLAKTLTAALTPQ